LLFFADALLDESMSLGIQRMVLGRRARSLSMRERHGVAIRSLQCAEKRGEDCKVHTVNIDEYEGFLYALVATRRLANLP
jgi:hypothetical protein